MQLMCIYLNENGRDVSNNMLKFAHVACCMLHFSKNK